MHRIWFHRGLPFLAGLACGVGLCAALASAPAQPAQAAAQEATAADMVRRVLKDFAKAAEDNDLEAALKLFATEEDMKTVLPEAAARKSAMELRSHIKLAFHEFVDALKAFGKHDLVEVDPGKSRVQQKGEQGMTAESLAFENGYIAFARDSNYLIELRFYAGGVLRVKPDRWVLTNMETRVGRFQYIQPEKEG